MSGSILCNNLKNTINTTNSNTTTNNHNTINSLNIQPSSNTFLSSFTPETNLPSTTSTINNNNPTESLKANPFTVPVVNKNGLVRVMTNTSLNATNLTSSSASSSPTTISSIGRSNSLPTPGRRSSSYLTVPTVPSQSQQTNLPQQALFNTTSNTLYSSPSSINSNSLSHVYHPNGLGNITTVPSNVNVATPTAAATNRQNISVPSHSINYTPTMGTLTTSNVSSNVSTNVSSNVFIDPTTNTNPTLTNTQDTTFQNNNPWLLDFQPMTSSYHQHYPNYHMNTIKNSAMETYSYASVNPNVSTVAAHSNLSQPPFYYMNLNNK
jgi:hypothetical protein